MKQIDLQERSISQPDCVEKTFCISKKWNAYNICHTGSLLLKFLSHTAVLISKSASNSEDGKPKYTCEICGKSYIRSWSYYGHMREHASGEKQHKCEVCNKVFNYASNLRQHMLIHTGNLLYWRGGSSSYCTSKLK